jgi:hypothetical protein
MFFEDFYQTTLVPLLGASTKAKVYYTGATSHPDLLSRVEAERLPRAYGGLCECEAGCIYSGRGPWCPVGAENRVNYRKRGELLTLQAEEQASKGGQAKEEFKFMNEDSDEEDLLQVKRKQLADLKESLTTTSHKLGGGMRDAGVNLAHLQKQIDDDGVESE